MKDDKKKKKSTSKSKKQNKYRALSLVLTSSLVIAPLTVPLSFYLPGGIIASAAILDAEILSNITSSNDSGTTTANRLAADGASKNVNFSISGSELVGGSVITSGTKQAVLTIPNELNGRVSTNGEAQINTNITLTVGDLTFLTGTLNAVNNLSDLLTNIVGGSLGSLTGVTLNLTEVNQKIDALNNLENFGSAEFNSTAVLSPDGKYIQANIDDGLGLVLAQNVSTLLQDLKAAVDALNATGSGIASNIVAAAINTALLPVKGTVDTAINLALPLVDLGGAGVNQLADASVLGSTTINIPTTIVSPTNLSQNLDARFVGTVVKADAIDVSLINTANGVSDIYYAGSAVIVAPPVVTNTTGTSATGYTVFGTATAGDTITIKNASGTTIASGPATGGNFEISIPQGSATANEALTATASNGGIDSTPTAFTTPADAVVVAPPVVTNTTGTSTTGYTVTGTATAGNTVDIRNSGGAVIGTGTVDGSGNFSISIPQGQATANENLTAIAKSGVDESTPTAFTTPTDAIVVAPPVVTNTTGTSTTGYTVTGTATAGNTIDIRNAGGTVIGTGTVDGTGNFNITIPQGQATASEPLTAIAKSGSDESTPTSFVTPADPIVVAAPVVTNTTGTSAIGHTVTGTATAGNTVEIRNTGGTTIGSGIADGSGNFTIVIPQGLTTANESLTAVAKIGVNESTPTPFTTPADPVVIGAPTVDNVSGTSTTGYTVTGTATAGNTVEIKNTGGTVIGTAVVDPSGNYTVTIPAGTATPNEQLSAVSKDADGNQSPATSFTTPADPVVVTAPTVDNVTGTGATGYTVTGTATAGNTVEIKNTGGTVIGTAIADPSGNYTVTIPAGLATPSQQLSAVSKDANGNQSPATSFTTPADPVVVTAPTVNSVTGTGATGYTVMGTATAGNTVEVKNTGGTVIGTAIADPSGNYTVTIPVGSATPNQQLSATAKDADGNQSPATPFTTPADPVVVTAPTVTNVTGTSTTGYTVTGTATAGNTVEIKNTGGTVIGTAITDSSGNYTVTIPAGLATPSQQLSAVAKDPDGNQSSATPFTTPADQVVVQAPTVDSVTGTSTTGYTVTGTAPAGSTVEVKNTGGTVIGTGVADGSGNYTVTIPAGSATPNEQLTATAKDADGNTSPGTSFTTPTDPVVVTAPTVDNVTGTSATGYTATGTAPVGSTVEIKNTGGTVIGTTIADPSGNYTVTIPAGLATPNQQLSATAKDADGNQSPATPFTTPADPVVVTAPTVDNVTGTSATGYTVTGTATAGNTVEVKNTGGTIIGTAVADPSGNYSVAIPIGSATPSQQLSAVAKDPDGNQSPATPFTTPADPVIVQAPTVDNVTGTSTSGYTVTGTAPAGSTVEIKNTGGTVIGTGVADGSGNYTVTIPAGSASSSEQLTATAKDADGNTSPGTTFTTPADPVSVSAPTVENVTGTGATGYTVTGSATAGNTVEIKNTGGTIIGTAIADPSGNYTVVIPIGLATPSQQLSAVAKDADGNQSPATAFTTPADPVVVTAPTVDSVTGTGATGYTVTGTATAGNTVEVKNTGGTVIGTTIADPSGNYTVVIPTGAATPNQQLSAVAKDANGNQSPATPFTTPADPVVVSAPTVDTVTGTSTTGYTINGTATAGNRVDVKNTGGTIIGTAVVNGSGNYTITIPVGSALPLQQLSAVAVDGDNNQSSATPFTTPADPVIVQAPTVDNVTGTSTTGYTVTGTAPVGSTVEVKNTGGTVIGTGVADGSGNYTVTIPAGSATPNEQLTATAKDADGNTSPGTVFTTPSDPLTIQAPVVTSVTGTSATGYTVVGTAVAGDTVSIKKLNGTVIGSAQVDGSGNYSVVIPSGSASQLEQLRAIDSDGAGNQSPATPFVTPADPVVVAAPVITSVLGDSQTGYTVKGTATANNSVSLRTLSGTEVGAGEVDSNGVFSISLDAQEVEQLQQLNAVAIDNALNSSLPTLFTIPADPSSNVEAPIINNVTGTSKTGYIVTGKATAGNKVKIRNAAGRIIGSGVADLNVGQLALDGEFAIALPVGSATENEGLTATAENSIGDVSTATPFKTPADPTVFVATPIINSVTGSSTTGYTIKGIATPGNSVELHNVVGEVLGAATASENGGFVIEIPIGFAEPKELVSAIAKDSDGNQSEPANFKLPADPGDGNGGNSNGTGNSGNLGNNGSSGLKNLSSSNKNLPNNGEIVSNWGMLGALLLGAFAFFTFKRKTKKEEE
ncbi:large repetitive protein [Enterococcus sp. DIV0724b]|uniref:Ig-like domain-containing protein n=1 Tax=Enterococcus sp. DIV0724b TaxID=2774694 RepID=UPI003D2FF2A6